jgi:hypothetical protein
VIQALGKLMAAADARTRQVGWDCAPRNFERGVG